MDDVVLKTKFFDYVNGYFLFLEEPKEKEKYKLYIVKPDVSNPTIIFEKNNFSIIDTYFEKDEGIISFNLLGHGKNNNLVVAVLLENTDELNGFKKALKIFGD